MSIDVWDCPGHDNNYQQGFVQSAHLYLQVNQRSFSNQHDLDIPYYLWRNNGIAHQVQQPSNNSHHAS